MNASYAMVKIYFLVWYGESLGESTLQYWY